MAANANEQLTPYHHHLAGRVVTRLLPTGQNIGMQAQRSGGPSVPDVTCTRIAARRFCFSRQLGGSAYPILPPPPPPFQRSFNVRSTLLLRLYIEEITMK